MISFNGIDITEDYFETILQLALEQASYQYAEEYKKLKMIQYNAIMQHDIETYKAERGAQERVDYFENVIDRIMRIARSVQ